MGEEILDKNSRLHDIGDRVGNDLHLIARFVL